MPRSFPKPWKVHLLWMAVATVCVVFLSWLALNTDLGRSYLESAARVIDGWVHGEPSLSVAAQPYPSSSVITDVQFDWSTHDRRAPGSTDVRRPFRRRGPKRR